jgi:hypothetical protein
MKWVGNLSFKSLEPVYFILLKSAFPDYRCFGPLSIENTIYWYFLFRDHNILMFQRIISPCSEQLPTMNEVVWEGDFFRRHQNIGGIIRADRLLSPHGLA